MKRLFNWAFDKTFGTKNNWFRISMSMRTLTEDEELEK